jgi:hypothetical protein
MADERQELERRLNSKILSDAKQKLDKRDEINKAVYSDLEELRSKRGRDLLTQSQEEQLGKLWWQLRKSPPPKRRRRRRATQSAK